MNDYQQQESSTKKPKQSTQQSLHRQVWPRRAMVGREQESLSLGRSSFFGNQMGAMRAGVVQTKLTVNEPDDQYEQEADQMAQAVMRMPNESNASVVGSPSESRSFGASFARQTTSPLGRAADSESERDSESEESDWMTDSVMRLPYHTSGRSVGESPLSSIQAKLIYRACAACEEDTVAARQAAAAEPPTVTAPVENRIQDMNGGGQPLPDSERSFFESRMGADFSGVRIHNDSNAAQTSRDLSARAFTVGNNIAFNSGEYQPGTTAGRELLAHELTHTMQQEASPQLKRQVIQRLDNAEETDVPTPEEKAAALAAAAEAEAIAAEARATGESETTQSQSEAVTEKSAGEENKAEADASKAEGPVQEDERKELEMTASAQAESQVAAKQEQQGAAQGKAESAKEAALAQPPALEAVPAPLAIEDSEMASSGAGLEGATNAATAQVESAHTNAENAPDKAPVTPEEDAGYTVSLEAGQAVGEAQQAHQPAEGEASEAQAAAESPAAELEGQAQTVHVGELEQTETPEFDGAAFKEALMAKVEGLAPQSADEADDFKESGKVDALKGDMQGQVDEERAASEGPLEEENKEPPDTGAVDPKSVTPLEAVAPGPAPSEIGADKAVPKPKGEGEVESPIAQSNKALDQQMADAEITEEQLQDSNEPEFVGALSAKDEAQTQAQPGVQAYREEEQAQISGAEAEAVSAAQAATQGMFETRTDMLTQVEGEQQQTKSEDEKAREKIATDISAIYERTKGNVEQILTKLDGKVTTVFDKGAEEASTVFENFVDAKMEAYKEKRYGGMLGWAKWAKDKVMGMPEEVNVFYAKGRQVYIDEMDAVIDNVIAIISSTLAEAKAEIANGKREIQAYVDQLPEELKQVGQEAAQEIQGKFDELEQQVNDKQGELIDTLAQKYSDNLQAIDARIEELKAANKGLVDKALEAIGGVIETILKLKQMLEDVLARAQEAIKQIIKDPIGFLENLLDAVQQGFSQFVDNIGSHLSKGLVSWLTGTLAEAGIKLPDSFDLQGIFQLVMQVAGISFDQIIGKLGNALGVDLNDFIEPVMQVIDIYQEGGFPGLAKFGLGKIMGEENVEALVEVVDLVKMILSGNFEALWELVKEHLSNLKEMVMEKIQEIVATEVIEAGVKWVLSLFNPAGAFIKACMMIYDVVMFFVNNGSKIMTLVNAVIDSVTNIASGDISGAADAIEQALATSIPVAIDFLASLLGLGDLPEKIKGVIETVRDMVDNAIDKILEFPPIKMIMGFIKKLIAKVKELIAKGIDWAKGKLGLKEEEGEGEGEGEFTEQDREAGLAAFDTEEQKYAENGTIGQVEADKTAMDVKQNHPVFKSITVVDGGDSWDYQYAFRQIGTKNTPNTKDENKIVDIDLKRPAFKGNAKKEKRGEGEDLRHEVSAAEMIQYIETKLNGKTVEEANKTLKLLNEGDYSVDSPTLPKIEKQAKKWLSDRNSDMDNLWLGPYSENRSKGAIEGHAKKNIKEAENKDELKEAIEKNREASFDPNPEREGALKYKYIQDFNEEERQKALKNLK